MIYEKQIKYAKGILEKRLAQAKFSFFAKPAIIDCWRLGADDLATVLRRPSTDLDIDIDIAVRRQRPHEHLARVRGVG